MAKVSLRAYNREIETIIDRGHLDEAIAHCQLILKTFPKHLETYRLLGKAYLEAKRYHEAVDIFSRVLVAVPSDFVSQVGMSIIRDEQDKFDDAIWHMERAYETQPSNAAIQAELQRLYGRRDGVQPSRIRMTRGALAHMYMQGDLYPQAISETKSVLQEDPGRTDMQVLLAMAYYKSGQKNDAADTASAVLKRYPYCLDANCVLTEVLGSDRPESAQVYRKRVIELDPYAAQVNGSVFGSSEVSDAAVMLDHLDWAGQQPTGMSSDWGTTSAIALGTGSLAREDAQPGWLKNALAEGFASPQSPPAFASDQKTSSAPAQADEDIPEFLRAAGWGQSTGSFDESKSSVMFDDQPSSSAQPLAEADMPDWVKAMAPQVAAQEQEEEIPDWINKIGSGELSVPSVDSTTSDELDWLNQPGSTSEQPSTDDQPDWVKSFGQDQPVAIFGEQQPDWLSQPGATSDQSLTDNESDWINSFGQEQPPAIAEVQPNWINEFAQDEVTSTPEPDRLSQPASSIDTGDLGTSAQNQDDSFAWLENLAVKQGSTEGLLTKPEEPLDEEPDWIKQVKELDEQAVIATPQATPSANVEEPGKSGQEIDDALAWFESLAVKQGATEGLLTKPEERLEEEPDWVKQARGEPPVQQQVPVVEPSVNVEELGKSGQEIDDALAWFESLAVKQGATEGLLTKPEERSEEEPDWVKQAKIAPIISSIVGPDDVKVEQEEAPADDVASWLRGLDADDDEQKTTVGVDDTSSWLKTLDETDETPIKAYENENVPLWTPQEEALMVESVVPVNEAEPSPEIVGKIEEPVAEAAVSVQQESSEDLPGWLSGLDRDKAPEVSGADDLPAWMRDDTGELVAEPTKIEPTRATDWHPVNEEKKEEVSTIFSQKKPAPADEKPEPKPQPKKKSAPRKTEAKPAVTPEPAKEPSVRRAALSTSTISVDPVLGTARVELTRSNIPGALETYDKLIKKGRFLDEVIFDLREALYRYPVEVSIWQTLGDAYMRANRLQDALDAYTKAEELLR